MRSPFLLALLMFEEEEEEEEEQRRGGSESGSCLNSTTACLQWSKNWRAPKSRALAKF